MLVTEEEKSRDGTTFSLLSFSLCGEWPFNCTGERGTFSLSFYFFPSHVRRRFSLSPLPLRTHPKMFCPVPLYLFIYSQNKKNQILPFIGQEKISLGIVISTLLFRSLATKKKRTLLFTIVCFEFEASI